MIKLRPHQQDGCDAMKIHPKGQLIVPTGGGKTIKMIYDVMREFLKKTSQTVVVVAPRILLAKQLSVEFLEHIKNVQVTHVHSGTVTCFNTTSPKDIIDRSIIAEVYGLHHLIFTTYHSLNKIQESEIKVNTIYFDEAHNSISKKFFDSTKHFSFASDRCYFFTATPKHSSNPSRSGMNDRDVYGDVILNVSAPNLVKGGFIVPPKLVVKEFDEESSNNVFVRDRNHIINSIDTTENNCKVLICSKSTKQIVGLVTHTDFCEEMKNRGYSVMYITSKTGAIIDNKVVSRTEFFDILSKWGKDDDKKFVILHHSILSEGINVSGLESVIFMRNMDYFAISQTIGRVIRLHHKDAENISSGKITPGNLDQYTKAFGLCVIPTFSKASHNTVSRVQKVVDIVFEEGKAVVSVIKK